MFKTIGVAAFGCLLFSALALGQANGHLQMHFMDVGQGDGAVVISPRGEVVLFDLESGLERNLAALGQRAICLRFHPTGQSLAACTQGSETIRTLVLPRERQPN